MGISVLWNKAERCQHNHTCFHQRVYDDNRGLPPIMLTDFLNSFDVKFSYLFRCGFKRSHRSMRSKRRMIIISSRGILLYASFMALAPLIVGCGPAAITRVSTTSPVSGQSVQVREFDASRADVRNYSEPVQPYGLQTAQAIVEALQEAGVNAEIAKADAPMSGQVIVEGNITLIEGGDTTSRVLFGGFGPVGATRFGVAGKARRADGTLLGEFAVERLAWMDIWWPSADRLLPRAARVIGYDIADMIITGRYTKRAVAPSRDTAERLQELQRLFDKGLVTREEYEQKRAAILKEF